MKKYDDDDLIRKPIVRIIIWGISILMIVVGSKHIGYNGLSWEGAVIGLFGLFLSIMLNNAYENLLDENDAVEKEGEQ